MKKTLKELSIGAICTLIITMVFICGLRIDAKYVFEESNEQIEAFETVTDCNQLEIEPVEVKPVTIETVESFREAPEEIEEIPEPEFKPLDIPLDAEVQKYLRDKCEDANIDLALVIALIDAESCFNANAKSHTGDYGLMQINKCNHKFLSLKTGATDFTDPYQNIDAGMYMLTNLFEKYSEAELVLMAYHFGEGGAKKLWNKGTYTSKYSEHILQRQLEYQAMLEDKNGNK